MTRRRAGVSMQRYVQWDVRNWSRAVEFWVETCGPSAFSGAQVLEVGSRDGGLSLWFAEQGASRVVCSDLAGPSPDAKALHADFGVSNRIEYASIDATQIGRGGSFDVVAFKSVLGGVGGVGGHPAQARRYEACTPPSGPAGCCSSQRISSHLPFTGTFVGDSWPGATGGAT